MRVARGGPRFPSRQVDLTTGPWPHIWKTVASISVVLLIGLAMHQAVTSTSGRKDLAGGMSIPWADVELDAGDIWSTERLCRHFKVENPGQVQIAFRVNTPGRLRQMIDNKAAINMLQTEIVYSQMEDTGKHLSEKVKRKKNVYAIPVINHSVYHRSTFTFDQFMEIFLKANTEQGLMLTFKDPRAVIPCLRLIRDELRYGRVLGPIIVDAEVLPGPGGFLPAMASVLRVTPTQLPGADLNDPIIPSELRPSVVEDRRNRLVPFHPTAFVKKVKDYVPGAILSLRWSVHGTCVDQQKAEMARQQLEAFFNPNAAASPLAAPGVDAGAAAGRRHSVRRNLQGLTDITDRDDDPVFARALAKLDISQELYPYDVNGNAVRYEHQVDLTEPMLEDARWLLQNTSWPGDAIFSMPVCLLFRADAPKPPPYKQLLEQKLGYSLMIHGVVDDKLTGFLKTRDLANLPDPSNTFIGDMVDAYGQPLAAKGILLPVGPPKLEGLEGRHFIGKK